VTADIWVGQPGKVRQAPVTGQPTPLPGDGSRVSATLAYDVNQRTRLGESHIAQADYTLPRLQDGQVYWFQPKYATKDGKDRWGEAIPLEMGRFPVDGKPANLALKLKVDPKPDDVRHVVVNTKMLSGWEIEGLAANGGEESISAHL